MADVVERGGHGAGPVPGREAGPDVSVVPPEAGVEAGPAARDPGGRAAWLCVAGRPVAPAEVAASRRTRRRGLLGRDGVDGALVLRPAGWVHTFGMRFAVDVAFVAGDGRVLRTVTLPPGRLDRPVLRSRCVVEAEAGALARWGVVPGAVVGVVDAGRSGPAR